MRTGRPPTWTPEATAWVLALRRQRLKAKVIASIASDALSRDITTQSVLMLCWRARVRWPDGTKGLSHTSTHGYVPVDE